jgi:uncharacterized protein (TIGR03083 family)
MDLIEMIADERRQLADLVDGLTEEQLRTPSLVPTWTVRDVAAHLTLGVTASLFRFALAFFTTGSLEKATDKLTWETAKLPVKELADALRRSAAKVRAPPGMGPESLLVEVLVHGLDLRRPIGVGREIPRERSRIALQLLATCKPGGFTRKGWREGLRFEATDDDWSYGAGPVLRGASDSLMLAITGRVAALDDLQGEGVAVLRERFRPPAAS